MALLRRHDARSHLGPPAGSERRVRRSRRINYALLTGCFTVGFFHRFAPATFAGAIGGQFGASATQLGLLSAMHFWVYTAMQIPAGMAVDRWGTRICVALGSCVTAAGSLVLATAPTLTVAAAGPCLTGLGLSAAFVGLMKSNAYWFRAERYGLITGVTMLLGNLGSVAAGLPAATLLRHCSWRSVLVAAAVAPAVLALGVLLLVRNRPGEVRDATPALLLRRPQAPPSGGWRALRSILAARRMWPLFWCTVGTNGTFYAFSALWGGPLLTDGFGLSDVAASWYTTASLAVYGVGSLLTGLLSDRTGRRKPFVVAASAAAVLGWGGLAWTPWSPGWSALALYGLVGLAAAQVTVSFAALKESVDSRGAATALSVVNSGVFLASALIQPLFGRLLDAFADDPSHRTLGDYRLALLLPLAVSLLGLPAAFRMRETYGVPLRHEAAATPDGTRARCAASDHGADSPAGPGPAGARGAGAHPARGGS